MEKRPAGPVIIRFKDHNEMVDLTIRMELKYFMAKLLYSSYIQEV